MILGRRCHSRFSFLAMVSGTIGRCMSYQSPGVKSILILRLFALMDVVEVVACVLHVHLICHTVSAGVPEFNRLILWPDSE